MLAANRGHIVTIASGAGIFGKFIPLKQILLF
jgi:hypothetical protein